MISGDFSDTWENVGEALFAARCLISAAHELGREDPYLGSSQQSAMTILSLILVAGEKLKLAEELHEAEWKAAGGNQTKAAV